MISFENRRKRYAFAACMISPNPAVEESKVSGKVVLAQYPEGGDVWIRTDLEGLPQPLAKYGFAILESDWEGADCASAGAHWNPTEETHGKADGSPSHAGDLQ